MKKMAILSASRAFDEATKRWPQADMNKLHKKVWELVQLQRQKHYEKRVNSLLDKIEFPITSKNTLRKKMLTPITANGVTYSNFMEEASRRLSQSTQTTSGHIAEWCVQRELNTAGLIKNTHYKTRIDNTDIVVYCPSLTNVKKKHRIEVKNVTMRERGIRGLSYDGDSIIGFFIELEEFGPGTVKEINRHCTKQDGYAYVPPLIFNHIRKQGLLTADCRFKLNTDIGSDMAKFCKMGRL